MWRPQFFRESSVQRIRSVRTRHCLVSKGSDTRIRGPMPSVNQMTLNRYRASAIYGIFRRIPI